MRAEHQLGRYRLIDEIPHQPPDPHVRTWRGHDEVLDRAVFIRMLHADDPRAPAFIGAARAAALVDDRRLLRVLDVLNTAFDGREQAVVVSEWASGRTLVEAMRQRHGEPLDAEAALGVVDEVARALAACQAKHVAHGRLRPSSVLLTDAGEVRVRGLAVDAALWGVLPAAAASKDQADVDGLGALLYYLCTARWPSDTLPGLAPAPYDDTIPPPSHLRAEVPRSIDDLVARSLIGAPRPRNVANLPDARAFATALGAARDYLAPAAPAPRRGPRVAAPSVGRTRMGMRVVATLIAVAIVVVVAVYGWQLVTGGRTAWQAAPNPDTGAFLTAMPQAPQSAAPLPESVLTIMGARSYDPYGDDDGNGKPDRKKGREGEDQVADAIDQDIATGWLSAAYDTPDLDGKGGVGLILDLGQSRTITGLTMMLNGSGSTAQVRVADEIQKFPEQWTLLEDVPSVPDRIDVRAAQPAKGRYVLLWFPTLGPTAQGTFQVGVQEVEVRGR